MATHEQTFSLFENLTSPGDRSLDGKKYPATDLVERLIVAAGYEICSPTYQRFNLSSYQFLSSARDVRDRINGLINVVDSDTDDAWERFDEYTELIDPAEDALLDFVTVAEKESTDKDHEINDNSFTSMAEYHYWIDRWEKNRDVLYSAVVAITKLLSPKPNASDSDLKLLRKQDDKAYFALLYKRMEKALDLLIKQNSNPEDAIRKSAPQVTQTWREVDKLLWQKRNVEDSLIIWNTKTVKLLIGAFELASRDKNSKFSKEVRSDKFWKPLGSLVDKLKDWLEGKADKEQVEKTYKDVVGAIPPQESGPIPEYIELMHIVHEIRRPFFGQAAVLVKLFKTLRDRLGVPGNSPNTELSKTLQEAHHNLKNALREGKESVLTLATDIPEDRRKAVESKFREAERRLKSCSKDNFKLNNNELEDWQRKIDKARETDYKHMKRLREINTTKVGPGETGGVIKIKVTVNDLKTKTKSSISCSVDKNMRMATFLWSVALTPDFPKSRVMDSPVFKTMGGSMISMDTKVYEVGQEVVLELP